MDVLPLAATVLLASLLGSLHCAGMCGAFLLFAVADPNQRGPRPSLHLAYHLGRLATYTTLGTIAGSLGAAFDLGGSLIGVQRTAAILAGAMMILFGAIALLRIQGVAIPAPPIPAAWQRLVTRGHNAAARRPPLIRALATGLLTTLLPCGWLYAFIITAAGTASPLLGAITMLAFWAGTLPVLASLGVGFRSLSGALGHRLPTITAAAVVVVGLATVLNRAAAIAPPGAATADAPACTAHALSPVPPAESR